MSTPMSPMQLSFLDLPMDLIVRIISFLDSEDPTMQFSESFVDLPMELIIRILSFLDFKDLTICTGVCRQFQEIIDTTNSLSYILELGLAGLSSYPYTTGLSSSQLLLELRSREHAWSNLTWRGTWKVPVGRKYHFWDLCGSTFVGGWLKRALPPNHAAAIDVLDIFDLSQFDLQSSPRQIDLDDVFITFAVDPGQDLLILVEAPVLSPSFWTIHIRSLSTGMKHHKAQQSVIRVPVAHEYWTDNDPGRSDLQILGDVLIFTQKRGPAKSGSITALNWPLSYRISTIYPALGDWSCTLLSETELLVAERTSFKKRQPSLEYYEIDRDAKSMMIRQTFQLPFSNEQPVWKPVYCYAPASFTCSPDSPVQSGIYPFAYPATPQIVAFRFVDGSTAPNGRSRKLDMFLLIEHLRRFKGYGEIIPWSVWGPEGTRCFAEALPKAWQRNIRGYRAVLPATSILLDFNSRLWDETDDGVVMESSQISLDSEGKFKIISSLPYRELRLPYPFEYKNILLGDSIVCIGEDANEHGKIKALRILRF